MKHPCDECEKPNSKMNRTHHIRLCTDCIELDEYKMICKTNAKNEYFLTDKDLAQYETISVRNCNPGYSNYVLYKFTDIVNCFCMKYNIVNDDEEIENEQIKLAIKRNKLKKTRQNNVEEREKKRKRELKKALAEYDLEL